MLCGSVYLAGCSPLTSAWIDSAKGSIFTQDGIATAPLDPQYEYIRATVRKSTFLLVRAASESGARTHAQDTRPVGIWVTPEGEILRLDASGRLVGSSGITSVDWRAVRVGPTPSWREILAQANAGQVPSYTRTRDVQPGDHYGLTETVTVRPVAAPRQPAALVGVDAAGLQWFEERSELDDPGSRTTRLKTVSALDPVRQALPASRFAVRLWPNGQEEVVYSEQCLSAHVCLALQQWPAKPVASSAQDPASARPGAPAGG